MSLKSLHVSGQQSKKKAYYGNSEFTRSGERTPTNDWRTKTNIMMQSALRVSYTSPKGNALDYQTLDMAFGS